MTMAAITLFIICVLNSVYYSVHALNTTIAPTSSPTYSPSQSPTRVPTVQDGYDAYIAIEYGINGIIEADQSKIETDTAFTYRTFWVNIQQINGKNIDDFSSNDWDSEAMILSARIETDKLHSGILILKSQSSESFRAMVTMYLRTYFVNNHLEFYVLDLEDLEVVCGSPA
eukprot:417997_1